MKGFAWFVELSQVIRILEADGQVRIRSVSVPKVSTDDLEKQ